MSGAHACQSALTEGGQGTTFRRVSPPTVGSGDGREVIRLALESLSHPDSPVITTITIKIFQLTTNAEEHMPKDRTHRKFSRSPMMPLMKRPWKDSVSCDASKWDRSELEAHVTSEAN